MSLKIKDPAVRAQIDALIEESAAQPSAVNTGGAIDLEGDAVLPYRGKVYLVPPLPVRAGLRLYDLQETVRRLSDREKSGHTLSRDQVAELAAAYDGQVRLFHRLIRTRWLRRRPWRNPFLQASIAEVALLGKFFSGCRIRTRFRSPA